MTVVYDPIPFKLVQKILVGNYEPIMRIFGKICTINLHNLQMLFMLWIKNKFSECLAPCPNMKTPMKHFLATVLPKPEDTVGHSGAVSHQIFFVPPQILLCSENLF